MESPVRTGSLTMLPVEYRETTSSIYGALIDPLSTDGAWMLSVRDMAIGGKLDARIFYANEYELDGILVVANIVSKNLHIAEDWKGYKYGLTFVHISEEDCQKLKTLLNNNSKLEKTSRSEDVAYEDPFFRKAGPPAPGKSDPRWESKAECNFYEKGKCLKTHAFCDLCRDEAGINLPERRSTIRTSKSGSANPFTSIRSDFAGNVKSAFRNH
jgi:hypothetical protein